MLINDFEYVFYVFIQIFLKEFPMSNRGTISVSSSVKECSVQSAAKSSRQSCGPSPLRRYGYDRLSITTVTVRASEGGSSLI